jgi:hypothetical protein
MSQWIRNYNPSEIDGDEWGNILVLRENGMKAVYHWQDYLNEPYANAGETAWMPLPKSDVPESISITIERGDRSWTIENNGFSIEIHDSRDPMGQPTIFAVTADTNMNALFADAVLSVLESEDEDEDCGCDEPIGFTVDDVKEFIDEIRANVPASKPKPWQKNRGK